MNYIIITRPLPESEELKKEIEKIGFKSLLFPTITLKKNNSAKIKKAIVELESFDWIVFTSQHGVQLFLEILNDLKIDAKVLNEKQIAVVGPKTAEELKKKNIHVDFLPKQFTTKNLGEEFPEITRKKFLLARSEISNPILVKLLQRKKAIVTNIPIYRTQFAIKKIKRFEKLTEKNKIAGITFTSPSTIEGFMRNLKNEELKEICLNIPVFSIGPITTKSAKKNGFKKIYTADVFTINGLFEKIKLTLLPSL